MVAIAMVAMVATVGLMVVSAKEKKGEALMQLRKSLRLSNCIPSKKISVWRGNHSPAYLVSIVAHLCKGKGLLQRRRLKSHHLPVQIQVSCKQVLAQDVR